MERLRRENSADERYPAAMAVCVDCSMACLRALIEQLSQFLDRVALSQTRGGAEVDRGRVSLLTLHSTKGLEFSRVYIVGAEDSELPGLEAGGKESCRHELEEGRRLLYVGMTRAIDRLVLTRVDRRSGMPPAGCVTWRRWTWCGVGGGWREKGTGKGNGEKGTGKGKGDGRTEERRQDERGSRTEYSSSRATARDLARDLPGLRNGTEHRVSLSRSLGRVAPSG